MWKISVTPYEFYCKPKISFKKIKIKFCTLFSEKKINIEIYNAIFLGSKITANGD